MTYSNTKVDFKPEKLKRLIKEAGEMELRDIAWKEFSLYLHRSNCAANRNWKVRARKYILEAGRPQYYYECGAVHAQPIAAFRNIEKLQEYLIGCVRARDAKPTIALRLYNDDDSDGGYYTTAAVRNETGQVVEWYVDGNSAVLDLLRGGDHE